MSTKSRWIIPCYFAEKKSQTKAIEINLTKYLKSFISNEIWNRKFDYGFSSGLKNTDKENIKDAKIIIFPRFVSGYVNEKRNIESIEKYCGKLPGYLKINNYKNWKDRIGVAIIEVEYDKAIDDCLPSREEFINISYTENFYRVYNQHKSVLTELSSFFLAGLHLSFPTSSFMPFDNNHINDGYIQINSNKKVFANIHSSNAFMHEVLIESDKLESVLMVNLEGLSSVWHLNLWPLKRYLIAVESDRISMDNLLDLIYSLEGLFSRNASSDFIKTFCTISISKTKKNAIELKELLDLAFRIRNDIAHGERSYDANDIVKLRGKDIQAEEIFWRMKTIVAIMITKCISKLICNPEMKNLKFNENDLLEEIYKK